jgi:hypothetical protein
MPETTIPLLPCATLEATLSFYQALGFDVTLESEPHPYGTARQGAVELHFSRLSMYGAKNAFGASVVLVDGVADYHRRFADGLRSKLGRVPVAGLPRITRLHPGQGRFTLFDPSGNMVIYVDRTESGGDWETVPGLSPLAQALGNAVFLRDTYCNDEAAAKALDNALERNPSASATDRARALAARAELAVALGNAEAARAVRVQLEQISLSGADRQRWQQELLAAEHLERWLTTPDTGADP